MPSPRMPKSGRQAGRPLMVDVVKPPGTRAPGLAAWLVSIAPSRARGAVTIAIVSDARIRALNRQFRRTDKATDVLSFPSGEANYLGDVVIAAGVAARQAREA